MQKGNPSIRKIELRHRFETLRKEIPQWRRSEASQSLLKKFKESPPILSFYSFGSEIDLGPLNKHLAEKRLLALPSIEKGAIVPYWVEKEEDLENSSLYSIKQPKSGICRKALFSEIGIILVPGLSFDLDRYRLGYGKGFYDRFLGDAAGIQSIGVGFREQIANEPLPREPWDLPVGELLLV